MKSQMGKRLSVQIPPFRPSPPARMPIGGRTGRFRVLELSVYFDYISDEESEERDFEVTLRIPQTKRNRRRSFLFWEFLAKTKLESIGIHTEGENWDEGIIGFRHVGRTNSYKPRYVVVNKKTKWCMPKSGGWGTLWWKW